MTHIIRYTNIFLTFVRFFCTFVKNFDFVQVFCIFLRFELFLCMKKVCFPIAVFISALCFQTNSASAQTIVTGWHGLRLITMRRHPFFCQIFRSSPIFVRSSNFVIRSSKKCKWANFFAYFCLGFIL